MSSAADVSVVEHGVEASAVFAALCARSVEPVWSQTDMVRFLDLPLSKGFLIRPAGEGDPAGFLLLSLAGDFADVVLLGIVGERRRQGLATTLLDQACRSALASGATAVTLDVACDNAPALALYRALDFQEVGRRPRYYARPDVYGGTTGRVDALVLRKILI